MQQWLDNMSTAQRLALTTHNATQTQALLDAMYVGHGQMVEAYGAGVPGSPRFAPPRAITTGVPSSS
jgi:hypothetical protein